MISKLSEYFSGKLLSNNKITEEDRELYSYGLFVLISQLMYLILTCVVGIIFGCFFESIIFYFAFQFMRKYAGGYHASTETRCEIMSSLSIVCSVGFIMLAKMYDIQTVLFIVAMISAVCILALSPLDTPEKELSEKEKKYFRKLSWGFTLAVTAIAIGSYFLSIKMLLTPCCVGLSLEGLLIISGKIKMLSLSKS